MTLNVGVVGYGYWSPNVTRNFAACPSFRVASVCDPRPERLEAASRAHPGVTTRGHARDLIEDPSLDALAIITPVSSHFDLAMAALQAGKHVWVEKPLTASSDQARRLVEAARAHRRVLMVDHTYIYSGGIEALRALYRSGELGRVRVYDSTRANLGIFRSDVNVLWDLASHDVSILEHVFGDTIDAVSAVGTKCMAGTPEHTVFMTAFLRQGALAHIHVSWLAPEKIRRATAVCEGGMVVYDDIAAAGELQIHDAGVELLLGGAEPQIRCRRGEGHTAHVPRGEPLLEAVRHFADCIEQHKVPITDGAFGLKVVSVLEAAMQSMNSQGRPVEVEARS